MAEKKLATDLNLLTNTLKNFGLEIYGSVSELPSTGTVGQIVYNEDSEYLYFWNGSAWVKLTNTADENTLKALIEANKTNIAANSSAIEELQWGAITIGIKATGSTIILTNTAAVNIGATATTSKSVKTLSIVANRGAGHITAATLSKSASDTNTVSVSTAVAASDVTSPTSITLIATANASNADLTAKAASLVLYFVNPMYVFAGTASTPTALSTGAQSARRSPAGTYSITTTAGQYVWFAVPSDSVMSKGTITTIKSSGFDVPFSLVSSTAISGYNLYRTDKALAAGENTFVIA